MKTIDLYLSIAESSSKMVSAARASEALTETMRAARGKSAFMTVRGPRRCPRTLMSLPCSLTTTGTPSSRPSATAAQPSGYAQAASRTSTRPR